MKACEGKLGRIFVVSLEAADQLPGALEDFASRKGIVIAQVFLSADASINGIIAPDASGMPTLSLARLTQAKDLTGGDVIIQEILGVKMRREQNTATGLNRLTMAPGSVTRVMTKPAPAPEESGPGTVPVYLFNAEFN